MTFPSSLAAAWADKLSEKILVPTLSLALCAGRGWRVGRVVNVEASRQASQLTRLVVRRFSPCWRGRCWRGIGGRGTLWRPARLGKRRRGGVCRQKSESRCPRHWAIVQ